MMINLRHMLLYSSHIRGDGDDDAIAQFNFSYLQFRQGNNIRSRRSLPNSSLTLGIVVIVSLGTGIEQFPPLIFVRAFTRSEQMRIKFHRCSSALDSSSIPVVSLAQLTSSDPQLVFLLDKIKSKDVDLRVCVCVYTSCT